MTMREGVWSKFNDADRAARILEATVTYPHDWRRTTYGEPNLWHLRRYAKMPDITQRERNRAWAEVEEVRQLSENSLPLADFVLPSGGTLTLSISVDPVKLTDTEREFVIGLVDQVRVGFDSLYSFKGLVKPLSWEAFK